MADKLNITRRDFLNGVALSLAAGTSLSPLEILAQTEGPTGYYPPLLTGLRGNHVGSFEIAHAVAMGGAKFGQPSEQTDSTYDLIVVGGGISGLAAAFLFRQRAGADKKVLVIDNHDDFGGHAKRNEFSVDGQSLIGYGGSQSLEAPALYSQHSKKLLADVGIDPQRFYEYFDQEFFSQRGLHPAIHFSKAAYGADRTLPNVWSEWLWEQEQSDIEQIVRKYPISDASKRALLRLLYDEADYLEGQSQREKAEVLRGISYSNYLLQYVDVTPEVVTLVRDSIKSYWGFGWDALSALEAYRLEMPGTYGLGLAVARDPSWTGKEPYIFHFPDGNASIARALIRKLLPEAVPGSSMEDIVTARADYSRLDREPATCRIRLCATAVDVRHTGDEKSVDVTYVRNGKSERVRGRHAVLACYNHVVPHICPEVGEEQRKAIGYAIKTPICYINIAIRNWNAFASLGCYQIYVPQADLMHSFGLDFPVSMGDYAFATSPEKPTVLHGVFAPSVPDAGLSQKEQNLQGMKRMLQLSFADYETGVMAQLDGALSGGGFDVERDVAGLTVNRWPKGYAYEYNDLFDPPEFGRSNGPHVAGRAQIGRISIANSDSHASAYVDGAIDAAYRAVGEQLALESAGTGY